MNAKHASPECVAEAPTTLVSLSVCPGRLLRVRFSAGDRLQVARGLAWYTIDGRLDDFFVKPGETRVLDEDVTVSLTGFGRTEVSLLSRREAPRFAQQGGVQPYRNRDRGRLAAALAELGSAAQRAEAALGATLRRLAGQPTPSTGR